LGALQVYKRVVYGKKRKTKKFRKKEPKRGEELFQLIPKEVIIPKVHLIQEDGNIR
jgi:hypothetical protein